MVSNQVLPTQVSWQEYSVSTTHIEGTTVYLDVSGLPIYEDLRNRMSSLVYFIRILPSNPVISYEDICAKVPTDGQYTCYVSAYVLKTTYGWRVYGGICPKWQNGGSVYSGIVDMAAAATVYMGEEPHQSELCATLSGVLSTPVWFYGGETGYRATIYIAK